MSSPSLLSLPPEIIQHTAFLLLASSPPALPSLGHTSSSPSSTGPLGPPSQLLPLFLTHRSLHATLTQPAFLAKVLRLKFDVGAVERRRQGERKMENSNTLTPEEMERMLICWCDCLTFIRAFVTKLFSISAAAREGGGGVVPQTAELTLTGDELQHVYAHMFTCFLMMLDNEGKNYAQLKHAGVHTFVDWFIRKCIWDPSLPYLSPAALQKLEEENDGASPLPSAYGWPVDTPHTSAAFLLYWLVLERPMLYNMPFVEKEEIIRVILPFVVMPFRYPTTEAPVNHFNLPLDVRKEKGNDDDEAIPTQQDPLSFYLPAYARAASVGQAQENGTTTTGGGISLEERREQEKEHGMPLAYPIYTPPYSRCLTVPYSTVNSIWANSPDGLARNPRKVPVQLVSLPPASMGAKMLFVAMREARPVVIPPVLPPGMSRRDYAIIGADVESDEQEEQDGQEGAEEEEEGAAREARRRRRMRTWRKKYLDRGKSARLPRGAEWDWDRGMAVAVNPRWTPDGPRAVRRPSSSTPPSTKEEEEEHLAIELEWENDNLIKPGDEESKKWDTMYWRMRMCADYTRVASPIAGGVGGERYVLGSLTGSVSSKPAVVRAVGNEWSRGGWVGKMYLPQGIQYMRLLMNTPYYPGSTHTGLPPGTSAPEQPYANALRDFSEASLGLVMQHVFVDFREHYRVCLCVKGVQVVKGEGETEGEREVQGDGVMGCGVIPLPPLERRVWDDGAVIQNGQGPRPRERVGRRSRRRIRQSHMEEQEEEEEQEQRQEQEDDAETRRDQTAPEPRAREGDDVDIPLDAAEIEEAIAEMADGNVHAQGSSARGPPAPRSGRAPMDRVLPGSRRDQQVDGTAVFGAPSTSQQDQALEDDEVEEEEEEEEEDDGEEEEEEEEDDDEGSAHSSYSEAEYTDSEDDSNEDDEDEDDEDMLPTYIDTSINNAWFPGEVGGMAWVGREGVPLKGRNKWVDEQGIDANTTKRREEVVFACNFARADPMTEDVCVRLREAALCLPPAVSFPGLPADGSLPDPSSSSLLQIHERDPHGEKLVASTEGENYSKPGWVYETWDKERMSMHDMFGCSSSSSASGHVGVDDVDVDKPKFNDHCPGCLAHERSEMLYRFKEAEEARKVLDGAMKALGEPPSSLEDEDMEDLDVDGMAGLKHALEGVVGDSAGRMDVDEDGHSQEHAKRKGTGGDARLAPACNGAVRDIVITGETTVGESYDNFQAPAAFYGRVRKWDGLIGILRYSRVTTSHIFIFGYVVGGNNFVGEWRVAGGDPIRPVWGNAFVMSMRDEDEE